MPKPAKRKYMKRYMRDYKDRKIAEDPNWLLRRKLRHVYGITLEAWQEMLARQQGRCAICRMPIENDHGTDHCHKTGKVRGILCGPCNRAVRAIAVLGTSRTTRHCWKQRSLT